MRPDGTDLGFSTALWRALDVVRLAATLYAMVAFLTRTSPYLRPWVGWVVLAVMLGWSVYVALAPRRDAGLVITDLVVAAGVVLANPLIDDPRTASDTNTVALIWPVAAVMSWAVWRGPLTGIAAAAVIGVCDLVVVEPITRVNVHNIVLLGFCGGAVGFAAQLYARTRQEMAAALQSAAAAKERERLARDIHDSVLQALAMIQRRGREIGGEAASLGTLAGEQEVKLRALVLGRNHVGLSSDVVGQVRSAGSVELMSALRALPGQRVQVSGPAGPVELGAEVGRPLVEAIAACLHNVSVHAGEDASTFVLVETDGDEVVVSVRDDGVGFEPGRLEVAAADGRLGMSSSIRGRVEEIGGTVNVWSAPGQGVEVELRAPVGRLRQ